MKSIQENNTSLNSYIIYTKQFEKDNLENFDPIFSEIIPEIIFSTFSVKVSIEKDFIDQSEKDKSILLGFFQACYTQQVNCFDEKTRQKAIDLFNTIMNKCEKSLYPTENLIEEMHEVYQNALKPVYRKKEDQLVFIKEKNLELYSMNYSDIKQQLGFMDNFLKKTDFQSLLRLVSLMTFNQPKEAITKQINVLKIQDTNTLSNLLNLSAYLEEKIAKKMSEYELKPVSRELINHSLFHLLWKALPFEKINEQGSVEFEESLKKIKEDIDSEPSSISYAIDLAAGHMIHQNLSDYCEHLDPAILTRYQSSYHKACTFLSSSDKEFYDKEFLKICEKKIGLTSEQISNISREFERGEKKSLEEEKQKKLLENIHFELALNYLTAHLDHIIDSKISQRDLKSFYSYELDLIARDAFQYAQDYFNQFFQKFEACILQEKSAKELEKTKQNQPINLTALNQVMQLSTVEVFSQNFLQTFQDELHQFNQEKVDKLVLSPFDLYQASKAELNQFFLQNQLIIEPFSFPATCPKTEDQVLNLLNQTLKKLEETLPDLNEAMIALKKPKKFERRKAQFNDLFQVQMQEIEWKKREELSQGKIDALSDLFDPKGNPIENSLNEKQIQLPLKEEMKAEFIQMDLTLGLNLEDLKQTSTSLKVVNQVQIEQIEHLVDQVKINYNELAFSKFLILMQKDPDISLNVINQFKDNWENGDKSLFGKDISEEESVFTEQRREELLKIAKHLSTHKDLSLALKNFKARLSQDLSTGRVIPQQKVIQARYRSFFDLVKRKIINLTQPEQQQWQNDYQKILADALLLQEMRNIEARTGQKIGSQVENKFLSLANFGNQDEMQMRLSKHQAELNVIKTLLEGQGLIGDEMEALRRKLASAKMEARLQTAGVPKDRIPTYQMIIQNVEVIYQQLLKDSQSSKESLNMALPTHLIDFKKYLIGSKSRRIQSSISEEMNRILKVLTQSSLLSSLSQKTAQEISTFICGQVEGFHQKIMSHELSHEVEKQLEPSFAFHNKWHHRLKGEMMQGIEDEQEIFGEGVCTGISSRWAVNDQKFPNASIADLCQPEKLKISVKDRVLQSFHSLAISLRKKVMGANKLETNKNILDLYFPDALKKSLGIQNVSKLKELGVSDIQDFFSHPNVHKMLQKSHGVIAIGLNFAKGESGHAIYARFDQNAKPPVFRIGEPNAGIFELKNKEEFAEFFKDLCDVFYKNNMVENITINQFELN